VNNSLSIGKMDGRTLRPRVRMDTTIPKLLVKISPEDAAAYNIKNLGEVTLRRNSNRNTLIQSRRSDAEAE
jgi:hypothetical protein